ncbi:hypothetical protein GcM3_097030, partial [Golovinomyces cichoracearum]
MLLRSPNKNIMEDMEIEQYSREPSPDLLSSRTPQKEGGDDAVNHYEQKNMDDTVNEENQAINHKRPGSTSIIESETQRPIFDFYPEKQRVQTKVFTSHEKPPTVKACMELTFNMVLRAMYLSEDLKEKQNLHDISV